MHDIEILDPGLQLVAVQQLVASTCHEQGLFVPNLLPSVTLSEHGTCTEQPRIFNMSLKNRC